MKIGILCNSRLVLPSLYFLTQHGVQLYLVLPAEVNDDHQKIESFAMQFQIPIQKWAKKELDNNINSWLALNQINQLWVMTFPYIIGKSSIQSFSVPALNFHFSPLPQYAGSQPIFWMIKQREAVGGICIHLLTEKIDGGPIVHFEKYTIKQFETFGSYLSTIGQLNIQAIQEVLQKQSDPNWHQKAKAQSNKKLKHWAKPKIQDVQINWTFMSAKQVEALCRACNPWNKGAITYLNGMMIKLLEVNTISTIKHNGEAPGTLKLIEETKRLVISTSDKKYLDIEIAYVDEGFYGNLEFQKLGLKPGMILT